MGDDNRLEMMESLFGAESGDSDGEPEPKPSDSNNSNSPNNSGNSGRDDDEGEGGGGGDVEIESDLDGGESEHGGSEGGREVDSEVDREEASDRDEASDREAEEAEPSVSGSETSHRGRAAEYEDNEVEQAREASDQGDDDQLDDDQGDDDQLEDDQVEDELVEDELVEDDPVEDDPVDDDAVEDDVVEDDVVEDEPIDNERIDEDRLDEEPVDEEPADEEPADEELADEEPADEEPADEEPADEEPAGEEPVDEEPVGRRQLSGRISRDVFGDSSSEEEELGRQLGKSRGRSPLGSPERAQSEDDGSDHDGGQQDELVVADEGQYESDEDQQAQRKREKPVGPPLDIDVPLKRPPGKSSQLHLIRVSNIMGIEPIKFDPNTFVEESTYATDPEGRKQGLRLEENVARWRVVSRDGIDKYESNARFVKWSDGSMQLYIGNEVLDLSFQDARHDQSHLCIRHNKGILQAQGRLLQKMKFMPSSLDSKSHKILTAIVDQRNKKVLKVKSVVTNIDPDKEKEGQEKAVEQRIRSKSDLQRKQEKISRKYYTPNRDREAQLSPGYLEGALEEEEEGEDYEKGGRRDSHRFQHHLDAERGAERRIINAKRQAQSSRKPPPTKRAAPSRREMLEDVSEEEAEESAYETDAEEEEELPMDDEEREFDDDDDDDDDEEEDTRRYSDKGKFRDRGEERRGDRDQDDRKRRRDISEEREISPPKKASQRRRVVVSESDDDD